AARARAEATAGAAVDGRARHFDSRLSIGAAARLHSHQHWHAPDERCRTAGAARAVEKSGSCPLELLHNSDWTRQIVFNQHTLAQQLVVQSYWKVTLLIL